MLRPLGRGLRDTLDNLLPFILASFVWWGSALLIVTAPAGTIALFTFADPNRLSEHLRPTRTELAAVLRRDLLRGWLLALAVAAPVLVLVNNLRVYANSDGVVRWLAPLWMLLLILAVTTGGIAASLRAVHGRTISAAIRQALILALGRAHLLLPVMLILWAIVALGGVLVVPALMFVPPLVAVTFNHITYDALGISLDDPLEPTPERLAEDARTRGGKYSVG
jgi:uncharacterized membrane protein YesL